MQVCIYQLHKYGTKKPCDPWGSLKQGEHSHLLKMSNLRNCNLYSFLVEAVKVLFEMNKAATSLWERARSPVLYLLFFLYWLKDENISILLNVKHISINCAEM